MPHRNHFKFIGRMGYWVYAIAFAGEEPGSDDLDNEMYPGLEFIPDGL